MTSARRDDPTKDKPLIDDIRSARAQMHVPVGLKLDMLCTAADPAARTAWSRNETLIKRLARIESLADAASFQFGVPVAPGTLVSRM